MRSRLAPEPVEGNTTIPVPRVTADPPVATLDTPPRLRLDGFPPGSDVTVEASMVDPAGRPWASATAYRVDAHGSADLDTTPALGGSYLGVDGTGPIWSMTARGRARRDRRATTPLASTTVHVIATGAGGERAEAAMVRLRLPPAVKRIPVRGHGLVGTLFCRATGGPYPGVLLLGGSEGGLHELDAGLLAGAIAAPPYGPATQLTSPGPDVTFATGGTPAANAAARAGMWRAVRDFLGEALS